VKCSRSKTDAVSQDSTACPKYLAAVSTRSKKAHSVTGQPRCLISGGVSPNAANARRPCMRTVGGSGGGGEEEKGPVALGLENPPLFLAVTWLTRPLWARANEVLRFRYADSEREWWRGEEDEGTG